MVAEDFNRDGFTDFEFAPEGALVNRPGGFQPATRKPSAAVAADFTGSGRLDVPRIDSDGTLKIARDTTPNYGNWIEIGLVGVKNNKLSMNAKVEVKAGANYQKQTYAGIPLVFRLGNATSVDTVRITWPNGLIQNEMKQPVEQASDHYRKRRASPVRAR